jgi:sorting nexin-8
MTSNGVHEPVRTTSTFTTASTEGSNGASHRPSEDSQTGTAWGSYDNNANASYSNSGASTIGGDGFGGEGAGGGDGPPAPSAPSRTFGGGRTTSTGPEESVLITLLPEKEGIFMFQHHNYQVTSPRRGSNVVRRYSDFVWLLDCLQKRYPFRQLPLLPPKRVGGMLILLSDRAELIFPVNGNHLAADSTFIEKRRRGLARFANALVRHPVLSQEQLVVMFLTVPTVSRPSMSSGGTIAKNSLIASGIDRLAKASYHICTGRVHRKAITPWT